MYFVCVFSKNMFKSLLLKTRLYLICQFNTLKVAVCNFENYNILYLSVYLSAHKIISMRSKAPHSMGFSMCKRMNCCMMFWPELTFNTFFSYTIMLITSKHHENKSV